jgi:hypothetical protein
MAEKCVKCNSPARLHLKSLHPLCKDCFCEVIEKRIRKHARLNTLFKKGDSIVVIGRLNQYLVPRIVKGLPLTITNRQRPPARTSSKVFGTWTLDDEVCSYLEELLTGRTRRPAFHSILKRTTDEELKLFAKYRKLEFTANRKNPEVQRMLDTLEKRHPETRFSLMKSIEALK